MTELYPNPYYNRCIKGVAPVVSCSVFIKIKRQKDVNKVEFQWLEQAWDHE